MLAKAEDHTVESPGRIKYGVAVEETDVVYGNRRPALGDYLSVDVRNSLGVHRAFS